MKIKATKENIKVCNHNNFKYSIIVNDDNSFIELKNELDIDKFYEERKKYRRLRRF